jgi:hypothetical protein
MTHLYEGVEVVHNGTYEDSKVAPNGTYTTMTVGQHLVAHIYTKFQMLKESTESHKLPFCP